MSMELHLNDILELKKDHPCGSRRWQEVIQPRRKVEKMIKRIIPKEELE